MAESEAHRWHWRRGRLQVGLTVYIHRYPRSPDRWVVQPLLIWDRK